MSSAFRAVARALYERGYSVIPIRPGFKIPGEYTGSFWKGMDSWQTYGQRLPTEDEIEWWETWPRAGLGICTGSASKLVAIDFDSSEELWPQLEALIPRSPIAKRGQKGYTAFYQYNGEISRSWPTPDKKTNIVELLSTGRQTVIPPTIHPKAGKPYEWEHLGLDSIDAEDLPKLPDNIIELFDVALGVKRRATLDRCETEHPRRSVEMISRALEFLHPDMSYPSWRDVGMGIHSEYPDNTGLALWDEWSARGVKHKPGECARYWRGFKPDGGITIGTVFAMAKLEGFLEFDYDERQALDGISAELNPSITVSTPIPVNAEHPMSFPNTLALSAPGLVGRITQWITDTAVKPQPALSLGVSLALVGAIKGRRVRTETNLRTNIYALGLAGSGSGKNHPLVCARLLLGAAGLSRHIGHEPGSEPGLIQALAEGNGRSVIIWDEVGHAISSMCNPNAGSYLASIMTSLTKLFSEAASTHQGKMLANGARVSIDQPCLCVFGATVPGRFFETLTNEHAIDGFLARWMVFEVEVARPKSKPSSEQLEVPHHLIEALRRIDSWPSRPEQVGTEIRHDQIEPRTVPFTTAARKMFWEANQEFEDRAEEAEKTGNPTSPIWVRVAEHAAKIALTVTDGPEIGIRELTWSLDIADHQARALCQSIGQRIGKNTTERNTKEVLRVIRKAGPSGVRKTQLYKETMWLSTQERNGILSTLIDSDQIGVVEDERKGKGARAAVYVAR